MIDSQEAIELLKQIPRSCLVADLREVKQKYAGDFCTLLMDNSATPPDMEPLLRVLVRRLDYFPGDMRFDKLIQLTKNSKFRDT